MACLHADFWGISIAQEVEVWPIEQGSSSSPMDESSDSNTDEGKDDDFMPGCGVLHFDNPLIPYKRIWIRVSVFISRVISIVLTNPVGRIHPDLRFPR
jgi:hypothetical protein